MSLALGSAGRPLWPAYLGKIYLAQNGLCFHCQQRIDADSWHPADNPWGWTREHVFPKSSTGNALPCNIVLACQPCNGDKADRQPTAPEIERAKAIYRKIGMHAFEWPGDRPKPKLVLSEERRDEADDWVAPPLDGEAEAAWNRLQRYVMLARIHIENRVPVSVAAVAALAEQFAKARARQIQRMNDNAAN